MDQPATDDTHVRQELAAIDPIVRPLVPRYLENRRRELARLESLLADGKMAELRIIGHDLRGSGGGYGLPSLSVIGATLETAALAGDTAALRAGIDQLRDFLDRVARLG